MAVALRSSFDLVYLPDHGFVGEDGGESVLFLLSYTARTPRLSTVHVLCIANKSPADPHQRHQTD